MKDNGYEVRDFVIENFLYGEDGRLQDDTSFLGNSIIDSTGVLELVAFIEEKYGIIVGDDEIIPANLDSLKNIENYLNRKLNDRTPLESTVSVRYADSAKSFETNQQGIIATEPRIL